MSQSLSINFSAGDLRFALGEPYVRSGIATYRLRVPIEVTALWIKQSDPQITVPVLVTGSVETAQPSMRWLGQIGSQTLELRSYPTSEFLDVSLSNDQLMALDQHRGDGAVVLYLRLQATVLGANAPDCAVGRTEGQFVIDASRWVSLLDQLGTEVSFLLRVPAPLTDSELQEVGLSGDDLTSLSKASSCLRQARSEFASHQWQHCVATCRQVLEILGRLYAFPSAKTVFTIAAQDRTQAQRWAAIYHDLSSMASAAHHADPTTADFVWSRSDAETILVTTAALLARYASQ